MQDDPFDLDAGTTEFYDDPLYYDWEFKSRKEDARWYTERYLETAAPVLELGVGTGRIALRAVRAGATVVGLEIMPSMLDYCRDRQAELPKKSRGNLSLHQGDMRAFDLGRRFSLISCPFNAFQHLYAREDAERTLACVLAHLDDDGMFLFDVLMPDMDYLTRSPYKRYPGVRFRHPTHHSWYRYSEQSAYDPVRQLNQMWFHFDREPDSTVGPEQLTIQLSHRYFYPEEMAALLHHAGFKVLARFGDFERGPLRADSESMVYMCARAAPAAEGG